jgi:5-formyltetrahydrofolate cyclo-ligase
LEFFWQYKKNDVPLQQNNMHRNMNKTEVRKYICEQNKLHAAGELATLSRKIGEKILTHKAVESANTIVLFWSMKSEVDTHELVAELVRNKNVILITQSADTPPVQPPRDAVIIVPGMAYDAMGHRLGRGKGYYDRFLSDLKDNYRIGICFPWQMVENLPVESHDMQVNEVLTAEM